MTDRLRSFWIQKIWLERINIIKKGFKLQNLRKKAENPGGNHLRQQIYAS